MSSPLCKLCNKPLPRGNKQFCSRKCYLISVQQKETQSCEYCGQIFQGWSSGKTCKRKYCSIKCSSSARIGMDHPNPRSKRYAFCEYCKKRYHQLHLTQRFCTKNCANEGHKKGPLKFTCEYCGKIFYRKRTGYYNYQYCGHKCRGLSRVLQTSAYRGPNWQEQRQKALKRDKSCCQDCDSQSNLHVHHIIPFRKFSKEQYIEANKLLNLVTLCNSCHAKTDYFLL